MSNYFVGQLVRIKVNAFGGETALPEDKKHHGRIVEICEIGWPDKGCIICDGDSATPLYLTEDEIEPAH